MANCIRTDIEYGFEEFEMFEEFEEFQSFMVSMFQSHRISVLQLSA